MCRITEYDGSVKCWEHNKTWGAISGGDPCCTELQKYIDGLKRLMGDKNKPMIQNIAEVAADRIVTLEKQLADRIEQLEFLREVLAEEDWKYWAAKWLLHHGVAIEEVK